MATAWTPLANLTLSADQSTVTFSSISGSYRDLIIIANYGTSSFYPARIRINGDTAANYYSIMVEANGSASTSTANTLSYIGVNQSYSADTNGTAFGANIVFQILDYSATDKHKTTLMRHNNPVVRGTLNAAAHRWANTAAITDVSFSPMGGGNYLAGSTFALYGVSA